MKLERRHRTGEQCPLCWEALRSEAWLICTGCRTHHHAGCFQELGGCATLGCEGHDVEHAQAPQRPDVWDWRVEGAPGVLDGITILLAGLLGLSAVFLVAWAVAYRFALSG